MDDDDEQRMAYGTWETDTPEKIFAPATKTRVQAAVTIETDPWKIQRGSGHSPKRGIFGSFISALEARGTRSF